MNAAIASRQPGDSRAARGFSLLELVGVLVIVTILAAVVVPKFTGSLFDEAAFADETLAALRYANRSAVTMQRTVCVTFSATSVSFTRHPNYVPTSCTENLLPPGGGTGAYTVTARGSASFSTLPTTFTFDRVGTPSTAQTINVSGGRQITVEAVTGYVH